MSSSPNKLRQLINRLERFPETIKYELISWLFGRKVKFVSTAGIKITRIDGHQLTCQIHNHKKVQNHINGVHAAAMALLAETATGLLTGLHLPDNKLPLLKSLHIDYTQRAVGSLQAVATLTDEQIVRLETQDKGDISVHVKVIDESGEHPIDCHMVWAWIPKQKPASLS